MSVQTVICPGCQSALRSSKPLASFQALRCPRCSHAFTLPAATEFTDWQIPLIKEDAPPSPPLTRQIFPLVALVSGLCFLFGGGITILVWANSTPKSEPAATVPNEAEQRLAEEKQRLLEREKKLDEKQAKLDQERKKDQFNRLVADAETALGRERYAEAEKLFSEALDLFSEAANAKSGLVKAKTGVLTTTMALEDKEKRQAEYQRLLALGKDKMTAKQYGAAVNAFQQAANLLIGDPLATKALEEAQAALATDAGQKKKLEQFTVAMEKGRAAMVGQRYQDALDAYQTAVVLMPDDLDATRGVRDAQRRLDDLNKGNRDQVAFQQEMTRGRAALRDRKASTAIAAFERALGMMPGDPDASTGLQQARKLQAETKMALAQLIQLGDVAMAAGRFEEAFRRYQDAVTQFPDDPVAQARFQKAQGALNDFVASQAAYARFMAQGRTAMQSRLYADAVIAFAEAVRIAPLDADAIQGLRDARKAVDKTLQAQQDVDRLITTATQALQQQQWGDAVRALNSANQLNPDDLRIPPLLSRARYGLHMAEGQAAFQAKRWADAARKFDEALQDNPGDVLARSRRDQARAMSR